MTGYTPMPDDSKRVGKSALGAENHVSCQSFPTTQQAIDAARKLWCVVVAAEITESAVALDTYRYSGDSIVVILWNEVVGVDQSTLESVDDVVYIPMQGHKESLNVGQTAAICMWELWEVKG